LRPPYADLQAAFRTGREDSAIYVLRDDGTRAFGVVPGPLPNQVTVFCGDLPLLQWVTPRLSQANVAEASASCSCTPLNSSPTSAAFTMQCTAVCR
ncbi:MAG TPA: hypothetical protein VIU62_17990, partial [Chloroflexota bacterium]